MDKSVIKIQQNYITEKHQRSKLIHICKMMITLTTAVNAIGSSILPKCIFPLKRFKNHLIRGAPQASSVNGSGWMKEDHFNIFINISTTHAKTISALFS